MTLNNTHKTETEVQVKITPEYFYYGVLYLQLPPVYLNKEEAAEFIRLSDTPRKPSNTPLYESKNRITCGSQELDYTKEKEQIIRPLIRKALRNNTGEKTDENEHGKTHYRFINGQLEGTVTIYTTNNIPIHTLEYKNGLPLTHIKYGNYPEKKKEFHFSPMEGSVQWIEYDTNNKIKDQGEAWYMAACYQENYHQLNRFDQHDTLENKIRILKIVHQVNAGKAIFFRSIDMRISSPGFQWPAVKILTDRYTKEGYLTQPTKDHYQITDKGLNLLNNKQ